MCDEAALCSCGGGGGRADGATGYSGELITRFGAKRGLRLKVAGRTEAKVKALAEANGGLPWAAFSVDDSAAVDEHFGDPNIKVVCACAGPFIKTYRQMVEACIRHGKHYIDINGENAVLESIRCEYGPQAEEKGVMLLPAAGFDVVPSDVLAHYLHKKLPGAPVTKLHLYFHYNEVGSLVSRGTASVMKGAMMSGKGISWRMSHQLQQINPAQQALLFEPKSDFGGLIDETVPLGPAAMADVSTAYHSIKGPDGLGVPCIETYVSIPTKSTVAKCFSAEYTDGVKDRESNTKVQPIGPTDKENEQGIAYVAGALFSSDLKSARAAMKCPAPYKVTYLAALAAIEFVLDGDAPPGFQSPTSAYGLRFVEPCGLKIIDI